MKRIAIGCALALALTAPAASATKPNKQDKQNAAKQCKAQRDGMGADAFAQLYGTGKNGKNAFGKCVSKHAREEAKERKAAKRQAKKSCVAEKREDKAAFKATYGKNAMRNCKRQERKDLEQAEDEADTERDEAKVNAAKECRAEQEADPAAFEEQYGSNRNKRNAFGKCVSQKAKAQQDDQPQS